MLHRDGEGCQCLCRPKQILWWYTGLHINPCPCACRSCLFSRALVSLRCFGHLVVKVGGAGPVGGPLPSCFRCAVRPRSNSPSSNSVVFSRHFDL